MRGMSEKARALQSEYMKKWKNQNPDKVKASNAAFWEKRAAAMFGNEYRPPEGGGMSEQAKQARRTYYAKRRADNPTENAQNVRAYWERKAERTELT